MKSKKGSDCDDGVMMKYLIMQYMRVRTKAFITAARSTLVKVMLSLLTMLMMNTWCLAMASLLIMATAMMTGEIAPDFHVLVG